MRISRKTTFRLFTQYGPRPVYIFLLGVFALAFYGWDHSSGNSEKPNVLFIAVDDLRPELACYGMQQVHTPNFDRLAERSVLFERAYCQQAVCAPSRNSILTGLRPDAIGIYDLYTFFRKKVPGVVSLPQHFKDHGYQTERIGKIYHLGHGNQDDSLSWSRPGWSNQAEIRALTKITREDTVGLERDFPTIEGKKLPYHRSLAPERNMTDAMSARKAIERMEVLRDDPFFLAVGFVKPHLPFVAPKKYWDLYNPNDIKIPPRVVPEGMPKHALANFGELRKYHGIPAEGPLDDTTSRNLIHGYYAAVSMIDAQVGRLLDALDRLDLTRNTIIVLWGDHGWKVGEYGSWCKHSNFELDTRVPLFISYPKGFAGGRTETIAELVDLYPTICDLADLPQPEHLEGESLVDVLKNPKDHQERFAISQYPRGPRLGYDRKHAWMGYSLRTDRYRYTRWQHFEHPAKILATELYDHERGFIAQRNLAADPNFQEEVSRLDKILNRQLAVCQMHPDIKAHRHP